MSVNGQVVTELGTKAAVGIDEIAVDGKVLQLSEPKHYLMLHKPPDVLCTRDDPQGRPTVMQYLSKHLRGYMYPVGRLDYDAEGLLLLTNDGELAHALTHPSFEVPKTYIVTVKGHVKRSEMRQLLLGVKLDDGFARTDKVGLERRVGNFTVLRITIHEGRKREVKRLCRAIDHTVMRLQRVALGPLELGKLPLGEVRELTREELDALRQLPGMLQINDDDQEDYA